MAWNDFVPGADAYANAAGGFGGMENVQPRPITDFYTGAVNEDYGRRARDAFYNRPSINTGSPDSPRITPAEFLRQKIAGQAEAAGLSMTPEQVEAGLENIFSHMTGAKLGNPYQVQMARSLLQELKGQSPVGDPEDGTGSTANRSFAGQTLSQRAGRRKDWFQDGRFMTSAGLDNQLDALRAYTLLGALEDDPALKLPIFNPMGNYLAAGGMINVGNPVNLFRNVDPTSDPGAGIRHLSYLRNLHSIESPVEARQMEALYWDRMADRGQQEGQYRSSLEGGYYWPYSYLNDVGMARVSEDRANVLSNSDENITLFLRDPGMWGGEQGRDLSRLGALVSREVPIVPEGGDPEQTRAAQEGLRRLSSETHQRMIDEYPLWQEQYNKFMPGTAMDVKKYSFPSPAWNALATAPAYSLDTITLGTMGASLPSNILKSAAKTAARNIAQDGATGGLLGLIPGTALDVSRSAGWDLANDQLTEQPFGASLYSAYNEGSLAGYFSPFGKSNVSDSPGMPGDGGQYRQDFNAFKSRQGNQIQSLLDYYRASHPAGELQIERNLPSPFTGQRR
jgi:hypothetical protein